MYTLTTSDATLHSAATSGPAPAPERSSLGSPFGELTPVQSAVLDTVADVVAARLCNRVGDSAGKLPMIVHVDGPGRTTLFDRISSRLEQKDRPRGVRGGWMVVRFDGWQYQRVSPPWWWMIKQLDKGLCARDGWRKHTWRDWSWRLGKLLADLRRILPLIVAAAALVVLAWGLSGQHALLTTFRWTATALAAVTALLAFVGPGWNALRRHLLIESPAGAAAALRTSDPMQDVIERYDFLVESARAPVAILIDNLDRCRAEYVVELLEGIQTLFSGATPERHRRQVVYFVAADRGWLCDSYVKVYGEFRSATHAPGRPLGLAFLEKIFDLSLRIPTVSMALSAQPEALRNPESAPGADDIRNAVDEAQVRARLTARERLDRGRAISDGGHRGPTHVALRILAVNRLFGIEELEGCTYTENVLDELQRTIAPGHGVRNLFVAYCVERTSQLLGGHQVDSDPNAIKRLGLWTVLTLRWPCLADDLARCPFRVQALYDGVAPDGASPDLKELYNLPEMRRFCSEAMAVALDAAAIQRFTKAPYDSPGPPPVGGRAADSGSIRNGIGNAALRNASRACASAP